MEKKMVHTSNNIPSPTHPSTPSATMKKKGIEKMVINE
jgi:hypothetical protein